MRSARICGQVSSARSTTPVVLWPSSGRVEHIGHVEQVEVSSECQRKYMATYITLHKVFVQNILYVRNADTSVVIYYICMRSMWYMCIVWDVWRPTY